MPVKPELRSQNGFLARIRGAGRLGSCTTEPKNTRNDFIGSHLPRFGGDFSWIARIRSFGQGKCPFVIIEVDKRVKKKRDWPLAEFIYPLLTGCNGSYRCRRNRLRRSADLCGDAQCCACSRGCVGVCDFGIPCLHRQGRKQGAGITLDGG